jgi:hypothetical protein
MKLEALPRHTIVPAGNDLPSSGSEVSDSDDQMDGEFDDDVVSGGSQSSRGTSDAGSRSGSFAGSARIGGLSPSVSNMSATTGNILRKQNKLQERAAGWIALHSGCTRGHGERMLRKYYKPRCEDIRVHVHSGIRALILQSPPCFCSLKSLNLRSYLIGNRGAQALWPLLRHARALKSVNLSGNNLHDSGAKFILSNLKYDVLNQGPDAVYGLLVLDLSHNPITGGIFNQLCNFSSTCKDVLMLGLAGTMFPLVKRQQMLRQSLSKFANAASHVNMEAWRLCRDPHEFTDRDLFVQAERVLEAQHGIDVTEMEGWMEGGVFWESQDDLDADIAEGAYNDDSFNGNDGFLGLDDVPTPRPASVAEDAETVDTSMRAFPSCMEIGRDDALDAASLYQGSKTARDTPTQGTASTRDTPTPLGATSARDTPTLPSEIASDLRPASACSAPVNGSTAVCSTSPPFGIRPPTANPFADRGRRPHSASSSWAVRRRKSMLASF